MYNNKILFFFHKIKRKLLNTFGRNGSYYLMELKCNGRKIGGCIKVFGFCQVNGKTDVGDHTVINTLNVIGSGQCTIGSYCHLAYGLTIITMNHNWRGEGIPYDDTDIEKPVVIGDFVWTGANVTILPGVTIGEGAIIQAGSVVRNDIPRLTIAGGNPATVFMHRDVEHWNRMKEEKRYF